MKKHSSLCMCLCLLIILFVLTPGCIHDDDNKTNKPLKVHIDVKPEIYSNTTFCFNVFVEDPDGNISKSRHQWDYDGDGFFDWDSKDEDCELYIENGYYKQYHSYNSPGKYTVKLTVTNEKGKSAVEKSHITVISESLSMSANLNKKAYLIDEPILITVTINNNGDMPINVSEMDFFLPTIGGSKISTLEGDIIQSMIFISRMPSEIIIDKNDHYTDTFDLLDYTFGIWDGQEWTEYNLTKRGKYTIEIIYESYPNGEVWNGNMKTEPITFMII